jgi:V/A-type H+/Na+-transporting ATPase subunit D
VRTERRTRAIENILLPELDTAVRSLEEQLDGMDQEEFARLRQQRLQGTAQSVPGNFG